MSDDRLSLGILLDEPVMERWAIEAVERAIRDADASVDLLVLGTDEDAGASRSRWERYASSVTEYGAWTPVLAWHRLVSAPDYLEKSPIEDRRWFDDAEVVRTASEPADGFGQRLPESTVERIDGADVDLLFRRGFGILKGEVLTTPTYGVVSFHHGNVRAYRGRPTAVWEFVNGEPTAGITLQRLTEELDGGEIVVEKEIDVSEHRTWQETKRTLFEQSTDMLAIACDRFADSAFEPSSVDDLGPLYTDPGVVDTARIELKNTKGRVLNRIDG